MDNWMTDAALILLGIIVLHLGWRALERWWQALVRRRVARRARRGERSARGMLRQLGYVIEAEQPRCSWPMVVGGRRLLIRLRADFLVSARGEIYVAEVKTGELVANLRHGPTRRQLLEYQLAYGACGVLLVDVLQASVVEVRFPDLASALTWE